MCYFFNYFCGVWSCIIYGGTFYSTPLLCCSKETPVFISRYGYYGILIIVCIYQFEWMHGAFGDSYAHYFFF